MTEHSFSATDAALRQRLLELSVHIPCGGIRGPVHRAVSASPMLWQSCRCEDFPVKWDRKWADVSRDYDLCIICFRGTAGGRARWAHLACTDCNSVRLTMRDLPPLKLERHSLANGIGVRLNANAEVKAEQVERLKEFRRGDDRLREWRRYEYQRLAASFDPLADVPLREWQKVHPPGRDASRDAFARLASRE
ncbi:hypothetical protein KXD98_03710 [Mycobacterium sp. SMC-4]|nr:hypothetical protein KXD98_03710 [Mycobacterium sp. SMC-4]